MESSELTEVKTVNTENRFQEFGCDERKVTGGVETEVVCSRNSLFSKDSVLGTVEY